MESRKKSKRFVKYVIMFLDKIAVNIQTSSLDAFNVDVLVMNVS